MKFRPLALAVLSFVATSVAGQAMAQEGPWQVRLRAVDLQSANKDSTGLGLSLNDKTIPEVDVTYFFTPNLAAELILTVPQKHDLRSNGTVIGSVKHLPPTLLAQYHFTGLGDFRPYVGLGLNYTRFSSLRLDSALNASLGGVSIDKNSYGAAVQVGVDWTFMPRWSLNLDIKKVQIRTDIKAAGAKQGEFKVDPLLVGLGVGYRF